MNNYENQHLAILVGEFQWDAKNLSKTGKYFTTNFIDCTSVNDKNKVKYKIKAFGDKAKQLIDEVEVGTVAMLKGRIQSEVKWVAEALKGDNYAPTFETVIVLDDWGDCFIKFIKNTKSENPDKENKDILGF